MAGVVVDFIMTNTSIMARIRETFIQFIFTICTVIASGTCTIVRGKEILREKS